MPRRAHAAPYESSEGACELLAGRAALRAAALAPRRVAALEAADRELRSAVERPSMAQAAP
eukprot:7302899-Alexandrium_andersonii.AAC.1